MNAVTVVTVGDTADNAIDALERNRGPVTVVRRCPELAGLLAACQSGLAQVAIVVEGTDGLTATLIDRLTAVGVSVVAVATSTAEASRLRGIGAWPLTGNVSVDQLTGSVLSVVSARKHHPSASFGFPMAEHHSSHPGSDRPPSQDLTDDAGRPHSAASTPEKNRRDRDKSPGGRGQAASGPEDPADVEHAAGPGMSNDALTGGFHLAAPSGATDEPPKGGLERSVAPANGGTPAGRRASGHGTSRVGLSGQVARMASVVAGAGSLLRSRGGRTSGGKTRGGPVPRTESGVQRSGGSPPSDGALPRILAIWGPAGSPGRTLVAINMAAELAAQGRRVMLVDADSYGASVAASLGLLDEAASFAQACRVADQGLLTAGELARISSEVVCSGGTFSLLTGLTRSDRWPELRAAAVERVLQAALSLAEIVVVDCGFCLETDEELSYDTVAPRRNAATLAALGQADIVYAVGSADAIGMPRLIRGLADLPEACAAADVRVVLNKVRKKAAGGSPIKALEEAWQRFGPAQPITAALPWDADVPARALLEGRLLQEIAPESPLRRAIRDVCCAPV